VNPVSHIVESGGHVDGIWVDPPMSISPQVDDVARFRQTFERHYDSVLAYALRRTRSREDAEEIVATTFTIAWRRIDKLAPEPMTRTWLYRVAWRTLSNQRRSARRRDLLVNRISSTRGAVLGDHDFSEPLDEEGLLYQALARLRPPLDRVGRPLVPRSCDGPWLFSKRLRHSTSPGSDGPQSRT
jgi:RNA polymerase sigma factor (sigma-70 family)